MEYLKSPSLKGAVLVTTPQNVSLTDVKKEISFCRALEVPILGLIENMSGYTCPKCAECCHVFSKGGGEALASEQDILFLGSLPIDGDLTMLIEKRDERSSEGGPLSYLSSFKTSLIHKHFVSIANRLLQLTSFSELAK